MKARTLSVYDNKPERFLERLHQNTVQRLSSDLLCAGFEQGSWGKARTKRLITRVTLILRSALAAATRTL